MPFPDRIVDAASRASARHASTQAPAAREVAGNGTHIPSQVSNARAPYRRGDAMRRVELTPHEKTVRDAILDTGAPERAALAWTMETYIARAATPEAREAVTRRMEAALAARGRDVAKLHHAGINVLDSVLTALTVEVGHMLEEGVVATPQQIDLCMILGAGWGFHLGGLTPYLDRTGYSERVLGRRILPDGVANVPAV